MKISNKVNSKELDIGSVTIDVFDKQGDKVKSHTQEIDSYVRNFWMMVWQPIGNPEQPVEMTNINGGTSSWESDDSFNAYVRRVDVGFPGGIVVGDGTTPVAFDDHALENRISNGDGVGEVSYSSQFSNALNEDGVPYIEVLRLYDNNSGDSIDINEVGLVAFDDQGNEYYLQVRDLLEETFTVGDGLSFTVTYTLKLTKGTNNWRTILLWSLITNPSSSVVSLNGSTSVVGTESTVCLRLDAGEDNIGGLMIGTDDTPFDESQNDLQARLNPGDIKYFNTEASLDEDIGAGRFTITVERSIINLSGEAKDIKEIGVMTAMMINNRDEDDIFLSHREVLDAVVTLEDSQSTSIAWEFEYTL